MPWNLLLFPLLGGFLFLHVCILFRYRSQRFESERLLLHSASWGVAFGVAGRLATFSFSQTSLGRRAEVFAERLVPSKDAPYLGTALTALLLGLGSAVLINFVLRLVQNERVKLLLVNRYDDGFLRMLYFSMYADQPVSLTLSTRKVYIGWVIGAPGNSPHDRFLTLLLLMSGHRSDATLQFTETVNYADRTVLAPTGERQIFTITIPMNQVVSANPFDRAVYEQEFADRLIN
jgi:hypothetical protein